MSNPAVMLLHLVAALLAGCGGSLDTTAFDPTAKGDDELASPSAWAVGVSFAQVASADPFGSPLDYDRDGVEPLAPRLALKLTIGSRSGERAAGSDGYSLRGTAHEDGKLVDGLSSAELSRPWHLEVVDLRGGLLIASCAITLSAQELQSVQARQGVVRRRASDCPNPDPSDPRRLEIVELGVVESQALGAPATATSATADQPTVADPTASVDDPATVTGGATATVTSDAPRATFVAPQDGEQVGSAIDVALSVTDAPRTRSVQLELDGTVVHEWTSPPYRTELTVQPGTRQLKLVVVDLAGSQHETDMVTVHASLRPAAQQVADPAAGMPAGRVASEAACNLVSIAPFEVLPTTLLLLGLLGLRLLGLRRRRKQ